MYLAVGRTTYCGSFDHNTSPETDRYPLCRAPVWSWRLGMARGTASALATVSGFPTASVNTKRSASTLRGQ